MTCDYEKYKTSTFMGKPGTGKIYMIKLFDESLKDIKMVPYFTFIIPDSSPKIKDLHEFWKKVEKLEPKVVIFDEPNKFS